MMPILIFLVKRKLLMSRLCKSIYVRTILMVLHINVKVYHSYAFFKNKKKKLLGVLEKMKDIKLQVNVNINIS